MTHPDTERREAVAKAIFDAFYNDEWYSKAVPSPRWFMIADAAIAAMSDPHLEMLNRAEEDAAASGEAIRTKAIRAALTAFFGGNWEADPSRLENMSRALNAADLARFGGDPGEIMRRRGATVLEQAKRLVALEAQITQLEREGSERSANQCHHGYAGEYGDHRCKYQDHLEKLEKNDREAGTHVEAVICMRSPSFTGDPPYVGWKGLGLALTQDYDSLDNAKARIAELEAALKPFAPLADRYPKLSDTYPLWAARVTANQRVSAQDFAQRDQFPVVTVGDLRRARAALQSKGRLN